MDITKILPNIQLTIYDFLEPEKRNKIDGLGERQKLVYKTLEDWASGATAKELSVHLHSQGLVMSNERNSVHPRLNELIDLNLIEVVGKRTCQYTDRRVSIYKTK